MVHTSPRLLDDLDWDDSEPEAATLEDPRFALRSLNLAHTGYSDEEFRHQGDDRPLSRQPDLSIRRRQRERTRMGILDRAPSFGYGPRAIDDEFRIAVLQPGAGSDPMECKLVTEHLNSPPKDYRCLSYAWGSPARDAAILVDGHNFRVTKNLLNALQRLRHPTRTVNYWIDQICINQDDVTEREQQVDIMKHIFFHARKIYVWLGESDARSDMLFRYAKKIRPSEDNSPRALLRLGGHRDIRHAMKDLLDRPWFTRCWVIPEVVLARRTTVRVGASTMTWELLVKLIRNVPLPSNSGGFDKEVSLLGNPRQRVEIISQMIASRRAGKDHTDITQLLILGKSSEATHAHDMVYAFHAFTYLTFSADYSRQPAELFVEVIKEYLWNILDSDAFASCHQLTQQQKTFQVMSIIFSAGTLHQDRERHALPSWIPDWTLPWHLAPIWCKTVPNVISTSKEWSSGIRSVYRAGGDAGERGEFEVIEDSHRLRLSALILDRVETVADAPTPETSQVLPTSPFEASLRYGRCSFTTTAKEYMGLATRGIDRGDHVAILLGGDVPVVLRRVPEQDGKEDAYQLLCECFVESGDIMFGDYYRANWTSAEEIVLL